MGVKGGGRREGGVGGGVGGEVCVSSRPLGGRSQSKEGPKRGGQGEGKEGEKLRQVM